MANENEFELEFEAGSIINHPTFGRGQVRGSAVSTVKDKLTLMPNSVRVEFREGIKVVERVFKRHILSSILAGEGVPYRDRHPYGERGEVCVAPSACDQPGHHGTVRKNRS